MSTTWRENHSFRRIFKGRRERTGRHKEEKRTLPGAPADVSTFSCVAADNPHPGAGMLTGFPFAKRRVARTLKRNFPMA
ncbi:hypothetical protein CERZMDRAFT_53912 [Cercospora zeae-maydis SCOH1-5]|uniref:Uncharacterized protein n=1 Tax=Cercospora zeae-maydis SCOH1-5 TaxID=717836 RepID=A0A6A6EV46_9PEZI|nr:hypothetical protein CERZMDRAFT_53912 [Cercospora zeae-maydis SCOH1-5]